MTINNNERNISKSVITSNDNSDVKNKIDNNIEGNKSNYDKANDLFAHIGRWIFKVEHIPLSKETYINVMNQWDSFEVDIQLINKNNWEAWRKKIIISNNLISIDWKKIPNDMHNKVFDFLKNEISEYEKYKKNKDIEKKEYKKKMNKENETELQKREREEAIILINDLDKI